ncbi:sensor histidine kinase [Streptomonospora alba]|uniref:sensor histidine kinase n=1 Tax=Streptomonospora alba TaxID=183763 RepID=UPI000699D6B2|nr:sensor histidine kinase [Streptomonospora alba]
MVADAHNAGLLGWLELTENRPPRILSLFFWGAIGATVLVGAASFISENPLTWPPRSPLLVVGVLSTVLVCATWLVIPWTPAAPARRKAMTVVFLAGTLFAMLWGNFTAFVLMSLAIGNALIVLGVAAAFGYIALAALFHLVVSLANPAQTLMDAALNTSVALIQSGAVLLVFLALFEASRTARQTRRLYTELEEAHAELRHYADRVRELTVTEERARMARDMHDSVGHHLTVVNLGLQNARRFRRSRPEEAWQEVAEAQRLTEEALQDARRWVRALRPLRLEGQTVPEAMRRLTESLSGAGVDVGFTVSGVWPGLAQDVDTACYRAAQEGLTNALRHSGARRIDVSVRCGDSVVVSVCDDGRGAEAEAVRTGPGLRGLRGRIEALGGDMECLPQGALGGTELRVAFPVNAGAQAEVPQ